MLHEEELWQFCEAGGMLLRSCGRRRFRPSLPVPLVLPFRTQWRPGLCDSARQSCWKVQHPVFASPLMQPGPGHEVIFLNHDRLDCRRENLRVVTKEEARRHHRVRPDSKSGIKGVRYNAESETWSACVYRDGHCYRVGTFPSQEAAVTAYEQELRRENPDLPTAPSRVERPNILVPVQNTTSE